jgi:hypothetical protein
MNSILLRHERLLTRSRCGQPIPVTVNVHGNSSPVNRARHFLQTSPLPRRVMPCSLPRRACDRGDSSVQQKSGDKGSLSYLRSQTRMETTDDVSERLSFRHTTRPVAFPSEPLYQVNTVNSSPAHVGRSASWVNNQLAWPCPRTSPGLINPGGALSCKSTRHVCISSPCTRERRQSGLLECCSSWFSRRSR